MPAASPTERTTPFDARTWHDRRELLWRSTLRPATSPGIVARNVIRALVAHGARPLLVPGDREQLPADLAHLTAPPEAADRLAVVLHYRPSYGALANERLVHYTMRETTGIEPLHVRLINARATLLLVPSARNRDDFAAAGVDVPVRVFHHGIDPLAFPRLERHRTGIEPYTFGTFGILDERKGVDVLLRAFRAAFPPAAREPVRLVLKSLGPPRLAPEDAALLDDPRVEVLTGHLDQPRLLALLRRLDAFVLPSRGEGFGLAGLEALATGLPLVATGWGGPVEYLDPADCYPLHYALVPARDPRSPAPGLWAEPDLDHLRHLLRYLYEHPAEASARGGAASRRVHAGWTWQHVTGDLLAQLDAVARGTTPA